MAGWRPGAAAARRTNSSHRSTSSHRWTSSHRSSRQNCHPSCSNRRRRSSHRHEAPHAGSPQAAGPPGWPSPRVSKSGASSVSPRVPSSRGCRLLGHPSWVQHPCHTTSVPTTWETRPDSVQMSSRLSSRTGCRNRQALTDCAVAANDCRLMSGGPWWKPRGIRREMYLRRAASLVAPIFPIFFLLAPGSAGASPVSVRGGPSHHEPPGPSSRTARSSSCSWPSRRAARRGRRSPRCGWRRRVSTTWRWPRPAKRSGRASPCRRPTPTRPHRPTSSRSRSMPFRASPRIRPAIRWQARSSSGSASWSAASRWRRRDPWRNAAGPDPGLGGRAGARRRGDCRPADPAGPRLDGHRRRAPDAGRLHAVRPSRSSRQAPDAAGHDGARASARSGSGRRSCSRAPTSPSA